MRQAGHKDFDTTLGYVRLADTVRRGFGDVFPGASALRPASKTALPPASS